MYHQLAKINYDALPESVKEITENYIKNYIHGLDLRSFYNEAYMRGYEDCETKWTNYLYDNE